MPPRVPRSRPQIRPRQEDASETSRRRLMKKAREATDFQPLMDAYSTLTEENYTMEAVDVLLHHLNPERMIVPEAPPIAPWNPGSGLPPVERRYVDQLRQQEAWSQNALFCGAEGLLMIQARCPDHLREETIQRITPYLGDLLAWFKYFQTSTYPLQDHRSPVFVGDPSKPCEAIWQWLDSGSELTKIDFKSQMLPHIDAIVNFAFAAFLATDARIEHGPFNIRCWRYNRMTGPGECPIMELTNSLLELEEYRQKIFETLVETRGLLNRVIKSAIARCKWLLQVKKSMVKQELEDCRYSDSSPLAAMLTFLRRTLDMMQRLCENPVFSEKLFKSDFFEHLILAANRWLSISDAKKDAQDRLEAFETARLCQAILVLHRHLSGPHWRSYSHALESLMKGGYLDVVVAAFQSPLREGKEMGTEMLALLQIQWIFGRHCLKQYTRNTTGCPAETRTTSVSAPDKLPVTCTSCNATLRRRGHTAKMLPHLFVTTSRVQPIEPTPRALGNVRNATPCFTAPTNASVRTGWPYIARNAPMPARTCSKTESRTDLITGCRRGCSMGSLYREGH